MDAGPLAVSAQYDDVAIAKERAGLARRQLERLRATPRSLEQTSARFFCRAGALTAREQVSRPKIAAAACVVSHELGERPIHLVEAADAYPVRLDPEFAHALRLERDLERNRKRAAQSILFGREIRKRLRVIGIAQARRRAKWLERVERHDPG